MENRYEVLEFHKILNKLIDYSKLEINKEIYQDI